MNILIVDASEIFAEGLATLIKRKTPNNITGIITKYADVLPHMRLAETDLIILDVEPPGKSGNELVKEIIKEHAYIRILVLSALTSSEYFERLINAGIYGFLDKDADINEIIQAIQKIGVGETHYGKTMTSNFFNFKIKSSRNRHFESLITEREKEVLKYIINGNTTMEICKQLFVSKSTIDTHRKNLLCKLGVRNTPEMIKLAIANQLV